MLCHLRIIQRDLRSVSEISEFGKILCSARPCKIRVIEKVSPDEMIKIQIILLFLHILWHLMKLMKTIHIINHESQYF